MFHPSSTSQSMYGSTGMTLSYTGTSPERRSPDANPPSPTTNNPDQEPTGCQQQQHLVTDFDTLEKARMFTLVAQRMEMPYKECNSEYIRRGSTDVGSACAFASLCEPYGRPTIHIEILVFNGASEGTPGFKTITVNQRRQSECRPAKLDDRYNDWSVTSTYIWTIYNPFQRTQLTFGIFIA